jgi:hypothetical protein
MHLPLRVITVQWGIPQNIARIARGFHHGAEIPANHYISTRWVSGRYLWERSVSIPWRSITHGNTNRKKVLQTAGLPRARAMRAVFCWTLRQEITLRTAPDLLTSTMALQSRPKRRSRPCAGPRRPRGLNLILRPLCQLIHTSMSGQPDLLQSTAPMNS